MTKSRSSFTAEECRALIAEYSSIRPTYVALAKVLEKVLKIPAKELGLPAIVQARPKDISSFAGKIQRPEKCYKDPLKEITDFCGARVISLTQDGVSRICRFVENNFEIFWEDSEDKLDSLGTDTFGYRSTHYIVAFRQGDFPESVVPAELIGLKAEIQVRTLLQHAWADLAHELSYKNAINLPAEWKRELSRLAAMLEETDQSFDRLQSDLSQYETSYRDHFSDAELVDEIARTAIVLEAEPTNTNIAHKLAKLAMTLEDWQQAVDVLAGFEGEVTAAMLRDLGVSQCKLHSDDSSRTKFDEGQANIRAAIEMNPSDVDAWASLGGTWRTLERRSKGKARAANRENARECYRKAFEIDDSDPYALGNFIEYELVATSEANVLPYLRPAILKSIDRSKAQARAGVNLPWAYLSLGEFYLFLGEPVKALEFYALGVGASTAEYMVRSPIRSFDLLDEASTDIEGMSWARAFLETAARIKYGKSGAVSSEIDLTGPIVIVAGACSAGDDGVFTELITESFDGFEGTVISGGTRSGIASDVSGLGASKDGIRTVGYVPETIPGDVALDKRYTVHRVTDGQDFSPLEPVQYWKDILASGVPLKDIRLVSFGGGDLSRLECCMALALGVPVGIVSVQGAPGSLPDDDFWKASNAAGKNLLLRILNDVSEVKSFVQPLGER